MTKKTRRKIDAALKAKIAAEEVRELAPVAVLTQPRPTDKRDEIGETAADRNRRDARRLAREAPLSETGREPA